ncbi:hypothetical protein H9L05_22370 (plasmid) [Hymenobacter qilianensis]|uniref:Polyvalent protein metallopeptidase domain-containing protein n=1 Tax=Hymenobacter qilianensis TaxID=1385715 RepID=A0A7H0H1T9_9BACT|nr:zincin-like metallopeptidase domain-containing protein [Hymenobacter qilianensis]QNP54505.1 hypothetical protein H9L05_22370 [Hymenobacter qilianensis]
MHQRAYYSPMMDIVNMPKPETFTTSEGYYQTLFHELTHSTGHKSRLDRAELTAGEGKQSTSYAREELIAEMGASFLSAAAGIATEQTEQNAVAYIQNWLDLLKNDKKLVVQAASKAQRAAEMILGHTEEPEDEEQPPTATERPAAELAAPELDDTDREFMAAEKSWLAE